MPETAAPAAPAATTDGGNALPLATANPDPNPASDAGKTLAARRAEIREKLKQPEPAKTDAPAAPAPAAVEAKPDDDLAQLIAEDRRIKARARELEAKHAGLKDVEEMAPLVRAAKEALSKGDKIGAIKALFPGEKLTGDKGLLWDMLKEAETGTADEGGVDLDALVDKKLEARERAKLEAIEAEKAAQKQATGARGTAIDEKFGRGFYATALELPTMKHLAPGESPEDVAEAYGALAVGVAANFTANAAKYPGVRAFGASNAEIIRANAELHQTLGRVPDTNETLAHIEQGIAAKAKAAGFALPAAAEPARPAHSQTVTPSWRSDVGRPAPAVAEQTLEEKRAEIRKKLLATG